MLTVHCLCAHIWRRQYLLRCFGGVHCCSVNTELVVFEAYTKKSINNITFKAKSPLKFNLNLCSYIGESVVVCVMHLNYVSFRSSICMLIGSMYRGNLQHICTCKLITYLSILICVFIQTNSWCCCDHLKVEISTSTSTVATPVQNQIVNQIHTLVIPES